MKERPILFSGPMVRAILEGRKTQTRRAIQPQPFLCPRWGLTWEPKGHATNKPSYCERNANWNPITNAFADFYRDRGGSPYGQPGDRLWVRETFANPENLTEDDFSRYPHACMYFRATVGNVPIRLPFGAKWKPSIFMPRWASRIVLEITEVRVQRVQDITEDDCRAEGMSANRYSDGGEVLTDDNRTLARALFQDLWDSINSKRGFGWDKNPWVWAITFQKL